MSRGDRPSPSNLPGVASQQRVGGIDDVTSEIVALDAAEDRRRKMLREARLAREHSLNENGDVWHPGGT